MNRLSEETSAYLLAHADNPVNWYPWGDEAFAAAESENKPIFLSTGYSSCHWCHVMEDRCSSIMAAIFLPMAFRSARTLTICT